MGKEFDLILTVGSLIIGIMMLTGHGGVFMRGGNAEVRKKLYDEKKIEKASGIALILVGIITGVDMQTTGVAFKIGYVALMAVIFGVLIYYIQKKCKK